MSEEPLTREEIKAVYNAVYEKASQVGARFALTGGAAILWLGMDRPTSDLDFVADRRLPVAAAGIFHNGQRYWIEGRTVDWTMQADERAPLFAEALDAAVVWDGLRLVRTEHLVAFKLSSGRYSDIEDVEFIKGSCNVDTAEVVAIMKRHGLSMPEADMEVHREQGRS